MQHILGQASVVDQKTDMIPALRLGQRSPGATNHALADPEALAEEKKRSERMLFALVGLGITTVVLLALIGWWIANLLAGGQLRRAAHESGLRTHPDHRGPVGTGGPGAGAGRGRGPGGGVGGVGVLPPRALRTRRRRRGWRSTAIPRRSGAPMPTSSRFPR